MGVPNSKRLRKRSDFQQIRHEGQRILTGPFVFQYRVMVKNSIAARRLGVIASRRVGNAVKRNRGKRLVRELFRINEPMLPSNCDLVVIVRSSFDCYSFEKLKTNYLRACMEISKKVKNNQSA